MRIITKLIAAAAIGGAVFGAVQAVRRRRVQSASAGSDLDEQFTSTGLEEPVVIAEEVVVITDLPLAER